MNRSIEIIRRPVFAAPTERVGWVKVEALENSTDAVVLGVATGFVGENGAFIEQRTLKEDGWTTGISWEAKGFDDARGLELVLVDPASNTFEKGTAIADSRRQLGPMHAGDRNGLESSYILGGQWMNSQLGLSYATTWATSPRKILQLIKDGLASVDASSYYPAVYYSLNLHLVNPGHIALDRLFHVDPSHLLPDPGMAEVTEGYLEKARQTASDMSAMVGHNEQMAQLIEESPGGANMPEKVPADFQASRREMYQLERNALGVLSLAGGRYLYLPTGFHSGGRTWPYMDSGCKDERGAFGMELDALRNGKRTPALSQLKKEREELERRRNWTLGGLATIEALAAAEQAQS